MLLYCALLAVLCRCCVLLHCVLLYCAVLYWLYCAGAVYCVLLDCAQSNRDVLMLVCRLLGSIISESGSSPGATQTSSDNLCTSHRHPAPVNPAPVVSHLVTRFYWSLLLVLIVHAHSQHHVELNVLQRLRGPLVHWGDFARQNRSFARFGRAKQPRKGLQYHSTVTCLQ